MAPLMTLDSTFSLMTCWCHQLSHCSPQASPQSRALPAGVLPNCLGTWMPRGGQNRVAGRQALGDQPHTLRCRRGIEMEPSTPKTPTQHCPAIPGYVYPHAKLVLLCENILEINSLSAAGPVLVGTCIRTHVCVCSLEVGVTGKHHYSPLLTWVWSRGRWMS